MSVTLAQYITQCRRLLHDANANFYTDNELTDYINDARNKLVRDTGCLRTIQSIDALENQEVYDFSELPHGDRTIDILNINLYWGNTRIPMRYMAWTEFNAQMRYWQNYIGRPIAFSLYGPQKFYLGPVPDQTYTMELDTVIEPTPMTNLNDTDTIPDIWTSPVAFYACYTAKFKEQSYAEADIFNQQYVKKVQSVLVGTFTRRMPNPYSQAY